MKKIANTQKQSLDSHLIGVAQRSLEIIEDLDICSNAQFTQQEKVKDRLSSICVVAALLHDIGKTLPSTQKYFSSTQKNKTDELVDENSSESQRNQTTSKNWHGVYHQEISWAFTAMLLGYNEEVEYVVYWHHKAPVDQNGNLLRTKVSSIVSEITDNEDPSLNEPGAIAEMKAYFDLVLTKALANKNISKHIQYLKGKELSASGNSVPDFYKLESGGFASKFDHQAMRTLALSVVIGADREVSSLLPSDLEKYVSGEFQFNKKESVFDLPNSSIRTERDKEQADLAKLVSQGKSINIVSIDTGAGKTSVSLLAKKNKNTGRGLLFLLPERIQVEAMFESVKSDYQRVFDQSPLSLQASHSGRVVLSTDDAEFVMGSDINILVFDRIISSFYNRSRFFEFMQMLRSDLVIDEFHKFTDCVNMWPSLSSILTVRKWLNNRLTLLISATPNLDLIEILTGMKVQNKKSTSYDISYFSRESVSPLYPNTVAKISISSSPEDQVKKFPNGCLRTFNTIDECQDAYREIAQSQDAIIHSRFNEIDKEKKVKFILSSFNKESTVSNFTDVFSAKSLQSSMNISRPNAVVPICLPFETPQELGRWARFGEVTEGEIILKHNLADGSKMYNENTLGFGALFKAYHEYVNKAVSEGMSANKREIMTVLFDNFFYSDETYDVTIDGVDAELTAKDISKRYISKYFKESILAMATQFPKRFAEKRAVKSNNKTVSTSNFLRGESKYVTAKVVAGMKACAESLGEMSGAVPISLYTFGKMKDLAFQDDNSFVKKVFSSMGQKRIFEYAKWIIGTKDFPLPASHHSTELEQRYISKVMFNKDYEKYYALYSSDIGLFFVGGKDLKT